MRITGKKLQAQLDRVNEMLGTSLQINNAPCYGGWQLTSNNGSRVEYHRVSAKEMLALLEGMSGAYLIMNNPYWGK